MSSQSTSAEPGLSNNKKRKFQQTLDVYFSNKKNKTSTDTKSELELAPKPELTAPFRFLDLPRELRDIIYDYALEPLSDHKYTRGLVIFNKRRPPSYHGLLKNLALLGTCKQVKEETQEALYRTYYFRASFTLPPPLVFRPLILRYFDVPETYFPTSSSFPPAYAGQRTEFLILTFDCMDTTTMWGSNPLEERESCQEMEYSDHPDDYEPSGWFRALHYMPALKQVRVLIMYSERTNERLQNFFKGEVKEAPLLRRTVRSLVAAVPKGVEIKWGITEAEAAKIFTDFWQSLKMNFDKVLKQWGFTFADRKALEGLADELGDGVERTDAEAFARGHGTEEGVEEARNSEGYGDS
ncbi:uncharacterized protein BDZ99DRAFT_520021 [Mytilinidion resinicola]|uniref:F-box domain-containing protein n=1 Tax=Mytilinidion resinicola TaxID=574789 RepID=A0A6A6YM21_9PEZI|nr:uncharacterized protein BDZ99DRAFT_520021 [Mytilinidion resinicola]KAF2809926.1 hypothetical protein BDZ99DRAFT_520021 [Mytilinidion resinicola]